MSDPYLTPCFTQKIDEHSWLNEIEQLTHKLKILHGIDDVRIGMELEYELAPNYKVESRIPRKKKLEFIQALDAEIIAAEESGDAKETARLKRKKDQVEQFLPAAKNRHRNTQAIMMRLIALKHG
jgi:hypothetical protein